MGRNVVPRFAISYFIRYFAQNMFNMDFGKRVLLLLLSLVITSSAQAQYTEEEGGVESKLGYLRYLGMGVGATYQTLNDPAISPIFYSRIGAVPMVNNIKVNATTYSEIALRASALNLTHNIDEDTDVKVKTQRALADYRFMVRIPSEIRNTDFRAGGMLSAMFAHKNAPHLLDAARVYEYAVSLGLCGKITKEVVLAGKTTFLSWDLAIPFLANISRPYYLNREELADPENKVIKDFLGNAATGSFGKFFRLNSRVGLMYRLDNGNAILFSYQWDYTRMKTYQKSYFAEHILSMSFMFNY